MQRAALLALLGLGYFFYFFHQVGLADQTYWDERIYVNAARAYAESDKPFPNPEHPPLGKQVLAMGMKLWGDKPEGWRFFAALSGAISGCLVVALVFFFTRREGVSAFVGALLFLDPLLYLHFRLGMLDPPLLVFLLSATYCALRFWKDPKPHMAWIYGLGLFSGLALATKLLPLVLLPVLWLLVLVRLRREEPTGKIWVQVGFSALLLPWLLYLGSHAALGYSLQESWDLLVYNFGFHQHHHGAAHMASRWYEWLYVGKPMWYFWNQLPGGMVRAVLGTGNLILWVGAELLAVYAVYRSRRRPDVWALAALVLIQLLLYALKPNTFLHYMVLILPFIYILMGIGIGDLFDRFGTRYRRLLQLDFACFFLGSLIVFFHYFPYLQGKAMTRQAFEAVKAQGLALPPEAP